MDVMCVLWRAPFEGHSDGGGPQRVQSRRNIWNIPNLLLNFRLETEQGDICFCFLKSHFTLNYWQDGSQLERCTLLWLCLTPFGWRSVSSWYLLCYRVQLLLFLFRIMWIDSQPYLLYWGFICAFELVSLLIYIYIYNISLSPAMLRWYCLEELHSVIYKTLLAVWHTIVPCRTSSDRLL